MSNEMNARNSRKYRGFLTTWKDDKGFGFIRPEPDIGTGDVFLHISTLKSTGRRPKVGDIIYYQLATDKDGKIRASNAVIEGVTKSQSAPKPLPISLSLVLQGLSLFSLPLLGATHFAFKTSNLIPIVLYPVMSLITYRLYTDDKSRSTKGQWRISEKTLHLCELTGGWMGAFIAQRKLRHKISKFSYQIVFWVIAIAHIALWVDWLFLGGNLMRLILIK
jgi:uncharacterized membrane protein YsdA (DUF1294 family)/cold shock CspA family protein